MSPTLPAKEPAAHHRLVCLLSWPLPMVALSHLLLSEPQSEVSHAHRDRPQVGNPSDKVHPEQVSEYDAFPICWVLLHGTVGTLQPAKGGEQKMSQGPASRRAKSRGSRAWGTYFPPLMSLLSASREITWPHMSLMGGLESDVCCLRMGHANTEWYQHFMPSSISI